MSFVHAYYSVWVRTRVRAQVYVIVAERINTGVVS